MPQRNGARGGTPLTLGQRAVRALRTLGGEALERDVRAAVDADPTQGRAAVDLAVLRGDIERHGDRVRLTDTELRR